MCGLVRPLYVADKLSQASGEKPIMFLILRSIGFVISSASFPSNEALISYRT